MREGFTHMVKLVGLALVALVAWWTGGFGLLGLLHWLVGAWVATAPALLEVGLLLAWLWGMIYVPAVRSITVGLLKVCLVILSFGLLLGFLSHASDDDVAAAAILMD